MTQQTAPRYDLVARIATGGMGEVWKATDTVLDREVAVKLLKPEYADDPGFRSRFQAEARNAAALHHPHVAAVFDFGELEPVDGSGTPRPYLVMELVPGEPLSALLRSGEPMPPETAAELVAQAADAVAAAHALGIVHRDLKPANLLVTPSGQVKITDFGIARAADAAALTATGQVLGTPQYLSPEQAEGKPATAASDIYALGVVLYECLSGRRPFQGDTPIATALAHLREEPQPLPDSIPAHLRAVTAAALAKDPGQRVASGTELAAALRGAPLPATPAAAGSDDTTTVVAAAMPGAGAAAAMAAGLHDEPADGTRLMTAPPLTPGPATPTPYDDRRRRALPGWLPWAGAAVAVLIVVVVIAVLSGGGDDTPAAAGTASTTGTTPSPSPRSASAAPRPTVRRAAYVGQRYDQARTALERLGYSVAETGVPNPGSQAEGTVADVSPTGAVPKGSTVTLSVWDKAPHATKAPKAPKAHKAPKAPPAPKDHGPGHGPGKGKGKKK